MTVPFAWDQPANIICLRQIRTCNYGHSFFILQWGGSLKENMERNFVFLRQFIL